MHRVGDVVRPVHDLRFQAAPPWRRPGAHPVQRLHFIVIGAELAATRWAQPRILGGRVQGGPREVQARAVACGINDFGLQPGQDAQVLGVALEPAAIHRHLIEGTLAVVSVRRMADVVGQPGQIDQIRVSAQPGGDTAADLRDLHRVRQPRARGVTLTRAHHLRLVGQPPERGAVQDTRPIPREISPVLRSRDVDDGRRLG
ncbi:Uncharacterised protein [Mycobacteroides abscessus subsp. massiliense]|nr:Uncharacterised protein [Mycobacteroides abscessus subsp. massiliense]